MVEGSTTDGISRTGTGRSLAPPCGIGLHARKPIGLPNLHCLSDPANQKEITVNEGKVAERPRINRLAATTVFLFGDALERASAALLIHEAARPGIAVHKIAIRCLRLGPILYRTNP